MIRTQGGDEAERRRPETVAVDRCDPSAQLFGFACECLQQRGLSDARWPAEIQDLQRSGVEQPVAEDFELGLSRDQQALLE